MKTYNRTSHHSSHFLGHLVEKHTLSLNLQALYLFAGYQLLSVSPFFQNSIL